MMGLRYFLLLPTLFLLAACGSSHRPSYSGHQESTEGVPGFVNGKKVSPHVKLGQSYTVDGETYVPRYEPDYVEEGLASWYGPGFHGGKTANGEEFDRHDMTAAHRTLPLPSVVKVTMLDTKKSVYVRINDRGPFAKGRILDMSRAAAEEIGLVGQGVARVRVEYLPKESQRFCDLLAEGREPQSIDLASEVIGKGTFPVQVASRATAPVIAREAAAGNDGWPSDINEGGEAPSSSVRQVSAETYDSASISSVSTMDLAPPSGAKAEVSPFAVLAPPKPVSPVTMAREVTREKPLPSELPHGTQFQLGAFQQQANADKLVKKVAALGRTSVEPKTMADGNTLYVVKLTLPTAVDDSSSVLAQLNGLGINPKILSK